MQTGTLRIVAEGQWVLNDEAGNIVSDSEGYALRTPCALHALLASRVTSVTIAPLENIALSFDTGHRLILFTEIGGFESLSITKPHAHNGEFSEHIF